MDSAFIKILPSSLNQDVFWKLQYAVCLQREVSSVFILRYMVLAIIKCINEMEIVFFSLSLAVWRLFFCETLFPSIIVTSEFDLQYSDRGNLNLTFSCFFILEWQSVFDVWLPQTTKWISKNQIKKYKLRHIVRLSVNRLTFNFLWF